MTPAGIEPATVRLVAQHLNHCATAVPATEVLICIIFEFLMSLNKQANNKQMYKAGVLLPHATNYIKRDTAATTLCFS